MKISTWTSFINDYDRAIERTPWLRALAAFFKKDPGSVSNAHVAGHNCNSGSKEPGIHLGHIRACRQNTNARKIKTKIKKTVNS